MTSESPEADSQQPETAIPLNRRINSNQVMLDLRQQVHQQERIIRSLIVERDSLTRELDSRLFLVEAQLRREQKHIEAVLGEKEQLIQFQAMQINSLKQLLSQVSPTTASSNSRNHRSSRRSLSKRYSVALDEYMKDHCVVSRALPVIVQARNEMDTIGHAKYGRTRSLPELRFRESDCCQRLNQRALMDAAAACPVIDPTPDELNNSLFSEENLSTACKECCRILSQEVMDEISNRRWTSDCDSEHSDSLDSGISSPSIKSRNMHDEFYPNAQHLFLENQKSLHHSRRSTVAGNSPHGGVEHDAFDSDRVFLDQSVIQKPKRSSSIGSFINRTFSSSSSQEKTKDNQESSARRHSSFSGAEAKVLEEERSPQKTRFISSANRTFGTNHRSVTKPRDIKFRKLFKFRRRTELEVTTGEDYMTV